MAQETLTVQTSDRTGAQINLQSITSADGFRFPNDGKTLIVVTNDAGTLNLGFTIQTTVDSEAVDAKDVAVTGSQTWVIGPFPTRYYNDANDYCEVTADADLASGVAPIQMGG